MRFPVLLVLAALSGILSAAAQTPPPDTWAPTFALPGIPALNAEVAVVGPDGDLYVDAGGTTGCLFDDYTATDARCPLAGRWDGTQWHPLGEGEVDPSDSEGGLHALVFGPDGALYAGGRFTFEDPDGQTVRGVARWDGTAWRALGQGFRWVDPYGGGETPATVRALAFGPDGALYAGGTFSHSFGTEAAGVARWDGEAWGPVGGGLYGQYGRSADVHVLAFTEAGDLLAGGFIRHAGSPESAGFGNVARWTGDGWFIMEAPPEENASHFDLRGGVVHDIVPIGGGSFVAAGTFLCAGSAVDPAFCGNGVRVDGVAHWNANAPVGESGWSAAYAPLPAASGNWNQVRTLHLSESGTLCIGGWMSLEGSTDGGDHGFACRGADGWTLPSGVPRRVYGTGPGTPARIEDLVDDGAGGLVAVGGFNRIGDVASHGVARWDGAAFQPLGGQGLDEDLKALALGPDGRLYAFGQFVTAAGPTVLGTERLGGGAAVWDGASWAALDGGFRYDEPGARAAVAAPNGDVYVAGRFSVVGDVPAASVARWDGERWFPVGGGLGEGVEALAYVDGTLWAGGAFTEVGSATTVATARWNGAAWEPADGAFVASVYTPTYVRDFGVSLAGELYAAGRFLLPDGTADMVRWAGTRWERVSPGTVSGAAAELVQVEVAPNGTLFAASLKTVYRRAPNATTWETIATADLGVTAIEVDAAGRLYASGTFTALTTDGVTVPARRLAVWDGRAWAEVAGGLDGIAHDLQVDEARGVLWAGGEFMTAGDGVESARLAAVGVAPVAPGEVTLVWADYGFVLGAAGLAPLEVYVDGAATPAAVVAHPRSFAEIDAGVLTLPANRRFDVRFRFQDAPPTYLGLPQDTTFSAGPIPPGLYAGNLVGVPPGLRDRYAPNPDGVPLDLALIYALLGRDPEGRTSGARTRADATVAVIHASTDAPAVDVVVAETGRVLADDLVYGGASDPVALPPGRYRVEVRRAADGAALTAVEVDLSAGAAVAVTVAGFYDPPANQGGPGLAVAAVDQSGQLRPGAPVAEEGGARSAALALDPVRPNPVDAGGVVGYTLAAAGPHRLAVYDALGRRVAVLAEGPRPAGPHAAALDASALAVGVYLVRLETPAGTRARTLSVVR